MRGDGSDGGDEVAHRTATTAHLALVVFEDENHVKVPVAKVHAFKVHALDI